MDIAAQIAQARDAAQSSSTDLLKVFAFVPDDKLQYSPSSTARSPLWLVGHCGAANFAFAKGIKGEPMEMPGTAEEFSAMVRLAGKDTATREEAIRLVEESTAAVVAALDNLTEERMAESIDLPFGQIPMGVWITIPGMHVSGHARQLDYVQTIWGDLEDHSM